MLASLDREGQVGEDRRVAVMKGDLTGLDGTGGHTGNMARMIFL
jgi:hypothetical protein